MKLSTLLTTFAASATVALAAPATTLCGGYWWSGSTDCGPGYVCYYASPYFSICVPESAWTITSLTRITASSTTTIGVTRTTVSAGDTVTRTTVSASDTVTRTTASPSDTVTRTTASASDTVTRTTASESDTVTRTTYAPATSTTVAVTTKSSSSSASISTITPAPASTGSRSQSLPTLTV